MQQCISRTGALQKLLWGCDTYVEASPRRFILSQLNYFSAEMCEK